MTRWSIGPSSADLPEEELTPLELASARMEPPSRRSAGAHEIPEEETSAPEELLSQEERRRRRARAVGPAPEEIANAAAAAESLNDGQDW